MKNKTNYNFPTKAEVDRLIGDSLSFTAEEAAKAADELSKLCIGADIQKDGVHYSDGKTYWKPSGKRNVVFSSEIPNEFRSAYLGKPYTHKQYKKDQRRRRILKIKKWIRGLIG